MKNRATRFFAFLMCCVIFFNASVVTCFAQGDGVTAQKIRVGWYIDASESGEMAHGYDYEYLQALAQYTNWEYEYVKGTWDECLKMLENGEIDILSFVQKTDDREKAFGFPTLPMAITSGYVVTSNVSEATKLEECARIGLVKGNAYNEELKNYCDENNINSEYVILDSLDSIDPALENGEIDAAVVAQEDKTEKERIILNLAEKNQYFATNIKNTELLKEVDSAMAKVNAYCPYLNSDLHQKYFSVNENGKPIFTSEEKEFISTHRDILVQYDSGWPPIEYVDQETGEYVGISPDFFKLLSKKCGINFVYEGSTSGDILSGLQSDDARNVLTTISYDYAWADSHDVYITQPFITSSIVKLGKNPGASNPTVAINEKAYFTYLLADELKNVKTVHYSKQAQRIEAVHKGDADYTFVTEDQANYYRSIPKYSNLKTEKMLDYEQKICISISKNSDPLLMSILSKSLSCISHDELTAIILKNTVDSYKMTFFDKIYKNRVFVLSLFLFLVAIVALFAAKMRVNKVERNAAVQENRAKSEFLSHVSHDIRTPLNAIIGITELAFEEENPDVQREYIAKVRDSGKYLLGLINDTLDMSKIENGKLRLHYDAVSYKDIYSVIMAVIMPKANEKDIELTVEQKAINDVYVMMDKLRMEQIVLNLLNNAVKFTPKGGKINCCAEVVERDGVHIKHRITITDTGVGMSDEFMKKLFMPFEQERNKMSVENAGTGLGLSIVKSLVDMMGGTISCTSKKNVGTQFVVELTSRLATEEDIAQRNSEQATNDDSVFAGKNVLLVEDNEMNILVADKMLEKKKINVVNAKNGVEAVNIFNQYGDGYFDAILMDIHMPVLNGIEATTQIRKTDIGYSKTVPIIALSANAYDEDKKECFNVGMNDYVTKPIEPQLLYGALRKFFN